MEFIEQQIDSLRENASLFTLHWLDDHSTDNTRETVLTITSRLGIELKSWHQPVRLGVPGVFLKLLECVTAEIYLFCDHDDIWQPGKIDATVANLLPDIERPTLCYSEPLVFGDSDRPRQRPYFDLRGIRPHAAQLHSRAFVLNPAVGNTIGFTRPLRELYLAHKDIAVTHAAMHDWWMYLLATAFGVSRLLVNVPSTLYRQHGSNALGVGMRGNKASIALVCRKLQRNRRVVARQASGFLLAAESMKQVSALEQLKGIACLIKNLDRRQTPLQILTLLRRRALQVPWRRALLLAAVCLMSDAGQ